jgi:hypothetical protein
VAVKASGGIFFAESDRPWVLDGANVHVSMVVFDNGTEAQRVLDGKQVAAINANLAGDTDTGAARPLRANAGLSFIGASMHGPFALAADAAMEMLHQPNPTGLANSDVVRPWLNGLSIAQRAWDLWIVDFPPALSEMQAALYEAPFEYVRRVVKPVRDTNRRALRARNWWLLGDPQKSMRQALAGLPSYFGTARVAKHRLVVRLGVELLPTDQVVVFPRTDAYFLGLLHSRLHDVWALAQGTQVRDRESGFRYTPTTCFETFPFPWAPGQEPASSPLVVEIGAAAADLCRLREAWLNPPEWVREEVLEFPATVGGPWDRFIVNPRLPAGAPAELHEPDTTAIEFALAEHAVGVARREAAAKRPLGPGEIGVARYPRLLPCNAQCAEVLAKRTLTNLYNQRPTWLDLAHRRLDEAVCATYRAARGGDWTVGMPAESILEQLLALNQADAAKP